MKDILIGRQTPRNGFSTGEHVMLRKKIGHHRIIQRLPNKKYVIANYYDQSKQQVVGEKELLDPSE